MRTTRPKGHTRRTARVATLLFAAVLTLTTACATEEPVVEKPLPTTSTPHETGASATGISPTRPTKTKTKTTHLASPPVLPDAAKENTEEGANAFAKHFLEVVVFSLNELDPKPIEHVSAESCKYCKRAVAFIAEIKTNKGWINDYDLEDISTSIHTKKGERFSIEVEYSTPKHSVSDGKSLVVYERSTTTTGAIVVWDSGWKMEALGEVE